jgi:hypothetical protein
MTVADSCAGAIGWRLEDTSDTERTMRDRLSWLRAEEQKRRKGGGTTDAGAVVPLGIVATRVPTCYAVNVVLAIMIRQCALHRTIWRYCNGRRSVPPVSRSARLAAAVTEASGA